jgi:hypothetical protein
VLFEKTRYAVHRFLEQRGLVLPSWWLTSVHAGYELVSGGKGLTTTWFKVHI